MKTGLNVVCLFKAVKYLGTITEPFITHEHVSVHRCYFAFYHALAALAAALA